MAPAEASRSGSVVYPSRVAFLPDGHTYLVRVIVDTRQETLAAAEGDDTERTRRSAGVLRREVPRYRQADRRHEPAVRRRAGMLSSCSPTWTRRRGAPSRVRRLWTGPNAAAQRAVLPSSAGPEITRGVIIAIARRPDAGSPCQSTPPVNCDFLLATLKLRPRRGQRRAGCRLPGAAQPRRAG
jgi:hypothetical protein